MWELRKGLLVAALVAAAVLAQVSAMWPPSGRDAVVLGVIAVVGAVTAFVRQTVLATVLASAGVFVVTGLVSGFSRAFFLDGKGVSSAGEFNDYPLNLPEAVALAALVVRLAWKAGPRAAAAGMVLLAVVTLNGAVVRVGYGFDGWVQLGLLVGVVPACVGLLLRMRERARVVEEAAAEERTRRDERLGMARELHDVVAHHVTGMLVQAQAALVVAEQDKGKACEMLPGIVDGGTDALEAMRAMVRTLRDGSAEAESATTDLAADLRRLGEKAGLPVRMSVELPEVLRPELGRSVLRLVQESLTNVRKHARDVTCVDVDVRLTAEAVLLSVVDDGVARPSGAGGFGLVGMRERVHELGGRFFAGDTGEGWLVTAELPLEVRA